MKGFIKRTVALLSLAGGLTAAGGCQNCYYRLVDPCYPERYEAMARQEVHEVFAAQVFNGHVLDQTVWNYHFEPGTDKLTVGGQYHLAYLARRRPHPDCKVFVQTALDLAYDPAFPEKMAEKRAELDVQRVQAVQRYLQVQTAGRPMSFDVTVHDPSEVGLGAVPMQASILQRNGSFQGVLTSGGGGGGAAAPASSGRAGN